MVRIAHGMKGTKSPVIVQNVQGTKIPLIPPQDANTPWYEKSAFLCMSQFEHMQLIGRVTTAPIFRLAVVL